MSRVCLAQVKQRCDGIMDFMEPYWTFVNCHMVNYITDKHWNTFVPDEMRQELQSEADVKSAIEELFFGDTEQGESEKFPSCSKFLKRVDKENLKHFPNLTCKLDQFLKENGNEQEINIKEFMSAKKCHEVEQTAFLIDKLIQSTENAKHFYVVDAGDGKGYLSSRIALQYGHRVLGIDANATNTENALKRNQKLQRAWNGLTKRAGGCVDPQSTAGLCNYKTTTRFITTELNLGKLLAEEFQEFPVTPSSPICLIGLHTCGNLAATCLQVFHAQSQCQILCNIGCCYHLLKEAFSEDEPYANMSVMEEQTNSGFPLSNYLKERQVRLGRNARMLASKSIERVLKAKELPNITLYYRALIEVLVHQHAQDSKNENLQFGKIKKFDNFSDYVQKCAKKLNANWLEDVSPTELDTLLQDYSMDKHYLEFFYLLRTIFAPVLESLILIDRLLYLKELGYERSYIIDLFDAVISPRHYAIVAFKS